MGKSFPLDRVIATITDITAQTDLPVSLDFECGYAASLDLLAETFARVMTAGVVGVNFEDQCLGGSGLNSIQSQQGRIEALVKTAENAGVPMFINARTDIFLQTDPSRHADRIEEAIDRAQAYADAGASGFFVPGLKDSAAIARICEAVSLPVNVMGPVPKLDSKALSTLGVKRISYGPNPFRDLMAQFETAARNIYRQ